MNSTKHTQCDIIYSQSAIVSCRQVFCESTQGVCVTNHVIRDKHRACDIEGHLQPKFGERRVIVGWDLLVERRLLNSKRLEIGKILHILHIKIYPLVTWKNMQSLTKFMADIWSQNCPTPNNIHILANTQPRVFARLRGGSITKPWAKVPRQNESRSDAT